MTSPSFTVIIPARYASSRFPGKPLIDIAGMSMVERVYVQSKKSNADRVVVATDDERIMDEVQRFGGLAVMTRVDHENGTGRLHEAAGLLGLKPSDVVVNVQGDEPLIPPAAIDAVAGMISGDYQMATLCERIVERQDVFDPNVVKVVFDSSGKALYFSRAPIPWARNQFQSEADLPEDGAWYRHLGIYAYTCEMLSDYVGMPATRLEELEKLEQLRVLAHGGIIAVAESPVPIPPGIDVPDDVERTLAVLQATG